MKMYFHDVMLFRWINDFTEFPDLIQIILGKLEKLKESLRKWFKGNENSKDKLNSSVSVLRIEGNCGERSKAGLSQ